MMEKVFTGNIYKAEKTAGHSAVFLFQALLFVKATLHKIYNTCNLQLLML
ncbi:hypothetical protein PSKAS_40430 [Peribacillus sp. N1]